MATRKGEAPPLDVAQFEGFPNRYDSRWYEYVMNPKTVA